MTAQEIKTFKARQKRLERLVAPNYARKTYVSPGYQKVRQERVGKAEHKWFGLMFFVALCLALGVVLAISFTQ